MSEVTEEIAFNLLRKSPSVLPFCHPNYRPPTTEEIRAALKVSALSQSHIALLTGVRCTDRGSATVRRWKAPEEASQYRKIPYSTWRLLLEYIGFATTEETRTAIESL